MTDSIVEKLLEIVKSFPLTIDEVQADGEETGKLIDMYECMLRIRRFEERIVEFLFDGRIKCPTHLYIGQEAVAAGVCAGLQRSDYLFTNHRSHGHYIAKGGCLKSLAAEIFGNTDGCSAGRGGSMHVADPEAGIMGSSAIVGGSLPLAVGTALASKVKGDGRVTVVFFGDGATDEGVFHEVLNFASLQKLPVLFVCENNFFSTHLPLAMRQPIISLCEKVAGYKIPFKSVYGNNVLDVYKAGSELLENMRQGGGATFLECITFRWRSHVGPWEDIDLGFRTKELVDEWMQRCPLAMFEYMLKARGVISESDLNILNEKVCKEVEEAISFAEESPTHDDTDVCEGVFAGGS